MRSGVVDEYSEKIPLNYSSSSEKHAHYIYVITNKN